MRAAAACHGCCSDGQRPSHALAMADTVVVASTRVRLKGVDAAELGTARRECPARDGHDDRYAPFEQAAALAAQPRSPYCKRS